MYRTFNDMTWPCPCVAMSKLAWRLRYKGQAPEDGILAASIIEAYEELILIPRARREKIIAELRKPTKDH